MNIRYDIKDSLLTLAIIVSYFEETTQATTKKQITKTTTQEHTSSLVDVMRLLLYMYTIYKHRVHKYDRRPAHFNIRYSLRDICVRVNWQTERGKEHWIWLYGTCKRNDIEEFDFDGDFQCRKTLWTCTMYGVSQKWADEPPKKPGADKDIRLIDVALGFISCRCVGWF